MGEAGGADLAERADTLEKRLERLDWEILARLLKRYALSVTGLLLVCLGAVLAMVLRESLPLVVYLVAFLPSVLDLILISSGEHMMREGDLVIGGIIMWSGNAALLVMFIVAYLKLRRN